MQQHAVDLPGLRSFSLLAERLNYGETASALGISPPALTRRIQRLEATLGVSLLERSTRRVAVTAEGLRFLRDINGALGSLDLAVETARAEARRRTGHLVLSSIPTMTAQLVPQLVGALRQVRPTASVRVVECGAEAVRQSVRDGTADLGFGFAVGPVEPELAFEPILDDPYCLLLPADHPLAERASVPWWELSRHKVITAGRQSGNMRLLDAALQAVAWRPSTQYEVDHLTTALGLVEAGLGIAVMPRSALAAPAPPGLAVRDLTDPGVARTLGVFRRRGAGLPPATRQMLAVVRRFASERRMPAREDPR